MPLEQRLQGVLWKPRGKALQLEGTAKVLSHRMPGYSRAVVEQAQKV